MATFDLTDEERNIALQALWNFNAHGQLSAGSSEQPPEAQAVVVQYLEVIDRVAANLGGKPNVPFSGSTQTEISVTRRLVPRRCFRSLAQVFGEFLALPPLDTPWIRAPD